MCSSAKIFYQYLVGFLPYGDLAEKIYLLALYVGLIFFVIWNIVPNNMSKTMKSLMYVIYFLTFLKSKI